MKGLRFEDRPDYDFLRGLFIKTLSTCVSVYGIEKEYLKFDWSFEDLDGNGDISYNEFLTSIIDSSLLQMIDLTRHLNYLIKMVMVS